MSLARLAVKPTDLWRTPDPTYQLMNTHMNFTLDAAASPDNAKCRKFFTEADNGLQKSWAGETVWCNPPYSRGHLKAWTAKAWDEAAYHDVTSCLLIPHDSSTKWWWKNVVGTGLCDDPKFFIPGAFAYQQHWGQVCVVPVQGRIGFLRPDTGKAKGKSAFPSVYVCYLVY